jgi:hypothetical protein
MNRILFASLLVLACLACLTGEIFGAEYCVNDEIGLQAALDDAATNGEDDLVKLEQGTYAGNFSYISSQGHSITILGGYTSGCGSRGLDPLDTVIDGGDTERVLYIHNSNGGDITVDGLTIQGGNSSASGGGIYAVCSSSAVKAGDITVTNNILSGNYAANTGGGLYAQSYSTSGTAGNVTVTDNTITGNTAENYFGGGASSSSYSDSGTAGNVIFRDNIFSWNNAMSGGGITAYSHSNSGTAGNVTLTNNVITGNSANNGHCGGVYVYASKLSQGTGNVVLTNNIITGNTSTNDGGGVYSYNGVGTAGDVTLVNNTVSGNTAMAGGGGVKIILNPNTINFYNNIIWGNTGATGGDIELISNTGPANGFNNDYSVMFGSWTNSVNNIDDDPDFVGGDDYHLTGDSPCIDTGDNNAPNIPLIDFEGYPRIWDGNDDGTFVVDMGAYEYRTGVIDEIVLLTPNGGEVIPSGSTYTVQSYTPSDPVSFKLKYSMDNGNTWKTIGSGITDTSYDWTVPTPPKNKTRCLVKVVGYDASEVKVGADKSNSKFTIEVVKLTSPNGGEVLTSGDSYSIIWSTSETKKPVTKVILKYTKNGGKKWKNIDAPTENLGLYDWTVPDVPKTKSKCKVKVVLKDAKGNTVGSDASDGYFAIEPSL